jgi:hypothetical protein
MKTNELTGAALDWAVAKCEGYSDLRFNSHRFCNDILIMNPPRKEYGVVELSDLNYSTDWAQGGPIIEREKISVRFLPDGANSQWFADMYYTNEDGGPEQESEEYGPTPLIAAMRCYVASKLGDEVDVPEELK